MKKVYLVCGYEDSFDQPMITYYIFLDSTKASNCVKDLNTKRENYIKRYKEIQDRYLFDKITKGQQIELLDDLETKYDSMIRNTDFFDIMEKELIE